MKTWFLLSLTAGLVLGGCGGSSSKAQEEAQEGAEDQIQAEVDAAKEDAGATDDAVAGAPRVSEAYQSTINRGWEKAVAGETPAYACAGLKGRLMGTDKTADADALEALYACNVLLPVRYFETYLDQVEAGEKTCTGLMTEMATQLTAMTISVDSIQGMADAMGAEGEAAESAAVGAVRAAVDEATLEKGLQDPKRLIKDRLETPIRKACPDLADIMLQ